MKTSEEIASAILVRLGQFDTTGLKTRVKDIAPFIAKGTGCDNGYMKPSWQARFELPLRVEKIDSNDAWLTTECGERLAVSPITSTHRMSLLHHIAYCVNEDMKQREALGWMKHIGLPWKVVGHPGCWHLVTDAGGYVSASAASDGPMADALRYISDRMNNAGLDGWRDKKGGG